MIFSDDLSMQAAGVAGDFSARASLALQAALENYANPASQVRLIRMHGASDSLDRQALMASKQWRRVVDKIKRLGDAPNLELDV